jgi:DNA-binding response OmpR family regulator
MERSVRRGSLAHLPEYSPTSTLVPDVGAPPPLAAAPTTLLLVDDDALAASYVPSLRLTYRVTLATTVADAMTAIERDRPAIVITEMSLADASGETICAAARRFDPPPTVLVMTKDPKQVPPALAAGCDSVLLKPFAANLLYARLGRLARTRTRVLRLRANARVKPDLARYMQVGGGTNRFWPESRCPHCNTVGVTSFEFVSHRRAWFACVQCRKVWIAPRLEDF